MTWLLLVQVLITGWIETGIDPRAPDCTAGLILHWQEAVSVPVAIVVCIVSPAW